MSTKIYNGYLLEIPSLEKAFGNIKSLYPALKKIAANDLRNYFAKQAIDRLDNRSLELSINPLSYAWQQTEKEITESRKGIRTFLDIEAEWTLIPSSEIKNNILCLFYCENKTMLKLWEKQSWVNEFMYYDNTDKPDNLSNKAWEERRVIWDKALGNDAPAVAGLSMSLWSKYATPDYEDVKQIVKRANRLFSNDKRAKKIAFNTIEKQFTDNFIVKNNRFPFASEWIKIEQTKEFQDEVNKLIPIIKNKLLPITQENLQSK